LSSRLAGLDPFVSILLLGFSPIFSQGLYQPSTIFQSWFQSLVQIIYLKIFY